MGTAIYKLLHSRIRTWLTFSIILIVVAPNSSESLISAQGQGLTANVKYEYTSHKIHNFRLDKTNLGAFGGDLFESQGFIFDVFTGEATWVGSEFPKQSLISHIGGVGLMIGGIVGGDTLVSSHGPFFLGEWNFELNPDEVPFGGLVRRSTLSSDPKISENAVSEEDYIAVYTDTFSSIYSWPPVGNDYFRNRAHIPLIIEVTEASYAWSFSYAEDFVIFDIKIRNIGKNVIEKLYFGLTVEPTVGWVPRNDILIADDDISGFLKGFSQEGPCDFIDTLMMPWSADNDGDPYNGIFLERGPPYSSARSVAGLSFIGLPTDDVTYSFNWWNDLFPSTPIYYDFGPRRRGQYRDFGTGGLGWPAGDVNKYYMMQSGEIDYDMPLASSISQFDLNWLYPDQRIAGDETDGIEHLYLYSVGPFDLAPGNSIPLVFVVSAGENFHTNPNNLANLYSGNVDQYYANLDFSDLVKNVNWAKWIYDNPGVDTDGDGYFGEYRVCVFDSVLDVDSNWVVSAAETTWYKGDGVPDWRAAAPPPAPKMWVTPIFNGIHIRFNGQESETTKDIFTQLNDFEGYRVYISRDDREQSYSRLVTYDIENYDKFIWNYQKQPEPGWDLLDFPMTMEEIRCAYASSCVDSLFDPLRYMPSRPYQLQMYPESLFYWEKHESNLDEFGTTTGIKKVYPNEPDPRTLPADSITTDFYTAEGYLKFFEYEYTIKNLLATVPYFVSVTALDFGWPKSGLEPLETSITLNAQEVFPNVIDSAFNGNYKQIVVYPNPYRNDQSYRARGFEGLGNEDRSNERVRRIHFANLPPKCTISIFSLDGDLVREIHHDKDPNDPTSSHVEWGLISRNGLAVVSGLYYWVVEFDNGEVQMGKLAIIL